MICCCYSTNNHLKIKLNGYYKYTIYGPEKFYELVLNSISHYFHYFLSYLCWLSISMLRSNANQFLLMFLTCWVQFSRSLMHVVGDWFLNDFVTIIHREFNLMTALQHLLPLPRKWVSQIIIFLPASKNPCLAKMLDIHM
jgi:hypothetical protein